MQLQPPDDTFINPLNLSIYGVYDEARLDPDRQVAKVRQFISHHHPEETGRIAQALQSKIRTLSVGEGVIGTDKRTIMLIGAIGLAVSTIASIAIFSTRQAHGSIKGKIVKVIPATGYTSPAFPPVNVGWNYLVITFDNNPQMMFLVKSAENLETVYNSIQLNETYLIEYSLHGDILLIEDIRRAER